MLYINILALLKDYKSAHPGFKKGEPIFMLGKELKQYRRSFNGVTG